MTPRSHPPRHFAVALALPALLAALASGPALGVPFYSAGVEGWAHAGDPDGRVCSGEHGQSYRTFPAGAFLTQASGEANGYNTCSSSGGTSRSLSSADLGQGTLRVSSAASPNDALAQYYSNAQAYFSDDVVLYLGNQQVSGLAPGLLGSIRLDLHGTRSTSIDGSRAYLDVSNLQGAPLAYLEDEDLFNGDSLVASFSTGVHFQAYLKVQTSNGEVADFGSTARLSISLPEGYSFRSTSGVLLSDVAGVPSPVPEPGTYAMLLGGFALTGMVVRRRRRGRAGTT